jgi:hypothetical protein
MPEPTGTTPTLKEVVDRIVQKQLDGVDVAFPASVVSFDPLTQSCKVNPIILRKNEDTETPLPIPIMGGVPVVFPSGGGYSIQWPLLPGDTVLVVLCSQSIEDWLTSGAPLVTPTSPRRHGLSDAVALPGMRPFLGALTPPTSPTALRIGGPGLALTIDETGLSVELGGTLVKLEMNEATGEVTVTGTTVKLGDATAANFATKAEEVLDRLTQMVTAYNLHNHGAGGVGPPTVLMFPPAGVVPPVNADKVLVK